MLSIWYTEVREKLPAQRWQSYLAEVPQAMAQKILRFRRWEDAHLSLFGKLLLIRALQSMGHHAGLLQQISYNDYDRPVLPLPAIDFNITHSGPLVACAIADNRKIGIDVEEAKAIDFEDFKGIWRADEWAAITSPDAGYDEFYRLWTCKEAVMKADGRGMSLRLEDIVIGDDQIARVKEDRWYLQKVELLADIPAHIASDLPYDETPVLKKLNFR